MNYAPRRATKITYKLKFVKKTPPIDAKTVYVAYSALLDYYDSHGYLQDQNPLRNAEFAYYFSCLMSEKLREKTRDRHRGAHPIYADEITKLLDMKYIAESAKVFTSLLAFLRFKAITSLAFSFIFRIDEVFSLEYRDIAIYYEHNRRKMAIDLHERKSVNYSESKFIVSDNPTETSLDPIKYVVAYIDFLQTLNKPMQPNNLVFPRIAGTSLLSLTKCTPPEYTADLKAALKYLGIEHVDISSHSLRKGGARQRFIYSSRLWSLDKVCYWAGWSDDTDVKNNSIGKYYLFRHLFIRRNGNNEIQ